MGAVFWGPKDSAEECGLPALIMGSKHRFLGGESARMWPKYRTSVSDVRLCCGEQSCHLWELQEKPVPRSASALGVRSEAALGWREGAGGDRPAPRRTRWNPCLALAALD